MNKGTIAGIAVGLIVLVAASGVVRGAEAMVLFDFAPGFDVGSVTVSDANISLSEGGTLRIQTGRSQP